VGKVFDQLEQINHRPKPFEVYTAKELWTDDHISSQMLSHHLNGDNDLASRKSAFIDRSVDWIISKFKIDVSSSVADFGCGPGLYTEGLARTNGAITGIDFSKKSIEYARNKAKQAQLDIDYLNQDYLDFDTEKRFDLIIMIYCDYCVLNPRQRQILLHKFKSQLTPNGSILLDVSSINAFNSKVERATYGLNFMDHFWSSEKYYGFLNSYKYGEEKVTLDKYTIIEKGRTREIFNWLQHFDKESIRCEFAKSGLRIEEFLANAAGDEFDPGGNEFAVIAKVNKEF